MEKQKEQQTEEKTNNESGSKINRKISDVYYTIKPIIMLEYFYGIYRFRFTNGDVLPPTWKMKVLGCFPMIINVVLFTIYLKTLDAFNENIKFMDVIDLLPSIATIIQYVTSAITASFLVNASDIRILHTFAEVDMSLHVETTTDYYKKSWSQTMKFFLALFTSHLFATVIDLVTTTEITMYQIIIIPLFFLQKLEILAFCKLIMMVKTRLVMINTYLSTFVSNRNTNKSTIFLVREKKTGPDQKFDFIGRISSTNTKISELAGVYDTLGETCSIINNVFNFQIFMTLVSTFTYLIITIWTSLYYYRTPESNSGHLINITIWCVSAVHTVAMMSVACERLLLVRKETKVLVNKLIMDYDLPKTMRTQGKAFMELVEAWSLRIFVYDMFSVDVTLVLKFVSVATTYLIVIIQISHFV